MPRLPRIALGAVQAGVGLRAVSWAFMDLLRRDGLQVQSFLSQACCVDDQGAAAATGANPRHVDSWLMSEDVSREVFLHGANGADCNLVEGRFLRAGEIDCGRGGRLEALCQWLDLAALAVVDVSQTGDCRLPQRPCRADALLLGRVPRGQSFSIAANLEALWGIPVVGALEAGPELWRAVDEVPQGGRPAQSLCRELGNVLARTWNARRVQRLFTRRELPGPPPSVFRPVGRPARTVIALAYDEAFNRYFPDTLDLFEMRGAEIVDFSPLRDERLPPGVDLVYLGGGRPDRFAEELSANHCMKAALRSHLRNGGRIYAEGGGMAFLAQQMETSAGQFFRTAGLLPAVARFDPAAGEPVPVEFTLRRTTWFGAAGQTVRGYRNSCWYLEPIAPLSSCVAEAECRDDLVEHGQLIASRLNLCLAAQPELLANFLRPPRVSKKVLDPWTTSR